MTQAAARRRRVSPNRLLPLALLLLACSCAATPAPTDRETAARMGSAAPLIPLFRALEALQAGKRQTVAILQIGDSHTANDSFSGRMRELFQQRFGNAGRGMLPPAIPYRYYRPAQILVSADGWASIRSADETAAGPFGLAGLRQAARGPASLHITSQLPGGLTEAWAEVLAQPGGGALMASVDAGPATALPTALSTALAAGRAGVRPVWLKLPSTKAATTLTLTTDGTGPVELMAVRIGAGRPGVTYSNLGAIGAKVDIVERWDRAAMRTELAQLAPALVVVAFGTNEGFKDSIDTGEYAADFARQLRAVRDAAPGAAILVAGPPDGVRSARYGGGVQACPQAASDATQWFIPPRLPEVRAIQRQAAINQGAAFWDWSAAMGGACAMVGWMATDPPKAARDGVHLFAPGYQVTADRLFEQLMQAYQLYRIRPR